jgi:peroxiredoxin
MMKNYILILLSIVFLPACSQKKEKEAEVLTAKETNDRPALPIKMTDGNTADFRELKGKAVLVLFQPDCDHCQQEAQHIRENLKAFNDYNLYFVSSSPMEEIEKFSREYQLAGYENIAFGWTTTENIINTFGPIQAPSVYIYSKEGKLVQEFNGQVDISVILKYL